MYDPKGLLGILTETSNVAMALQLDQLPLQQKITLEDKRYRAGQISLEELGFWYKCLIRAFLAQIDGLCNAMRMAIVQHGPTLGLVLSRKDERDLSRQGRIPVDRSVVLAFRNFPKLFNADYRFDNSGADFRGFTALLEARDKFTHPKTIQHLCPFEMFPTMNPSIEWLYGNFGDMLRSCISAIGFQVKESVTYERRFYFKDDSLTHFEEARRRYDGEKSDDGLIGQLRGITFALWDDTKLALRSISETIKEDSGPACAIRNFTRALFSEIEGCVFVAALSLYRFRTGYEEPKEELLIGSHEEVRARIISTLEAFSQEFGTNIIIEKEGPAWGDFLAARELRNRLIHPKAASDLELCVGDMDMIMKVSNWWHSSVDGCFELNGQKLVGRQSRIA
jgi:hypothetical protein